MQYLEEQGEKIPALAETFAKFGELYTARLWHQLSVELRAFVSAAPADYDLASFYAKFIKSSEDKLTPLLLAHTVTAIAGRNEDVESAVDFIKDVSGDFELEAPPAAAASTEATAESSSSATKVAGGGAAATKMDVDGAADDGATESKVAEPTAEEVELKQRLQIANQKRLRIGEEGYIICMCEVACLRMRQEEQLKCKRLLQKATALVDTRDVDLLDPSVNSTLHGSHASYFKKYGPPEEFFKHALQYLAYTPLAGLSTTEQTEWAVDVCLSAMLGKDVYNFGSVLASPAAAPILASLSGTENAWLVELLKAFSAGDAASFKAIIAANAAVPALAAEGAMAKLQDKLNLCCLMELVFKTPSSERTITFDTVAAATGLAVGEVEMMLMHALSLELIRGDIDGVASTISVTWVLPRVLDTPQMGALKTKLVDWSQRVQTTLITLEDHAAEVMLDC